MGLERSRHDADVDVAVRGSGRRAFAGQSWRVRGRGYGEADEGREFFKVKGAGQALGTSLRGDAAEDSGCIVCADSACLTDLDGTISDMRHYTGF